MHAYSFINRGTGLKISVLSFFLLAFFSINTWAKPVQLKLADVNGKEYSLASDRGKWVVVNYWATWCSPCLKEIPEFNKLYMAGKKSNIQVLGVNFEEASDQQVKTFVGKYKILYPVLLEEFDVISQMGMIEALPKTFIVSPEGELVYQKLGMISQKLLLDVINQLKAGN